MIKPKKGYYWGYLAIDEWPLAPKQDRSVGIIASPHFIAYHDGTDHKPWYAPGVEGPYHEESFIPIQRVPSLRS